MSRLRVGAWVLISAASHHIADEEIEMTLQATSALVINKGSIFLISTYILLSLVSIPIILGISPTNNGMCSYT